MKKIHLLHYLLLCYMVLAVATSCGDDEDDYAPDNVNDPEKLTDPLPTTDQLGVTHNNTLYYLSFWSKEDHMISENMINRYKEAVPYAPGKKMEVGDAFFFTRQDIDRIQSDTDLLADIKDMFHKRSIVMMMEGGTNEDFNTVCTLLDCYNPYAKEDESYSDELPLWVFSGPLPSASGFYSKLNALSTATGADGKESVQTINEYGQGFHCDMTSQSLQRALEPKAPSNGSSDLKNLISAYIVIGQNSWIRKCLTYNNKQIISGQSQSTTGCIIFRGVEAYLNYLEAYYLRNNKVDGKAKSYWDAVRNRAGITGNFQTTIDNTDMNKETDLAAHPGSYEVDATLYNIRRERRCEFIGEGMRWDDLVRWRAWDGVLTNKFIPEGYNFWEEAYKTYELPEDVTLKDDPDDATSNISSRAFKYIRPFSKVRINNQVYDGYSWAKANYLSPVAINEMRLASPDNSTDNSVIYQNPYWPEKVGGTALE